MIFPSHFYISGDTASRICLLIKYFQCGGKSNHWLVAMSLTLSLFSPSFLRHNILFSYIFHSLREGCRSPVWGPWQMSTPAHSRTLRGREGVSYGSSSRLHGSHLLGVSSSGFQWLAAVDQIIFPMQVQQREMHIFHSVFLGGLHLGGISWNQLILFSSDEGGRN